jgi:hypothetical protein
MDNYCPNCKSDDPSAEGLGCFKSIFNILVIFFVIGILWVILSRGIKEIKGIFNIKSELNSKEDFRKEFCSCITEQNNFNIKECYRIYGRFEKKYGKTLFEAYSSKKTGELCKDYYK